MKKLLLPIISLICSGCMTIPESRQPVTNFDLDQYLGKWYEIARLDHPFERGLEQVTAEYSLNFDGSVKVLNRGFSVKKNEWSQAEGRAKYAKDKETGYLKVSFFGPFYASYIIFELDKENYEYAYISGKKTNYLWFLSRNPIVSEKEKQKFIKRAKAAGFNTDELIFVKHD